MSACCRLKAKLQVILRLHVRSVLQGTRTSFDWRKANMMRVQGYLIRVDDTAGVQSPAPQVHHSSLREIVTIPANTGITFARAHFGICCGLV